MEKCKIDFYAFEKYVLNGGSAWYFNGSVRMKQLVTDCFNVFGHINFFEIMGCHQHLRHVYRDAKVYSYMKDDKKYNMTTSLLFFSLFGAISIPSILPLLILVQTRAKRQLNHAKTLVERAESPGQKKFAEIRENLAQQLYQLLILQECGCESNWLIKEYLQAMDFSPNLSSSTRVPVTPYTLWDFVFLDSWTLGDASLADNIRAQVLFSFSSSISK
ncbi:unnamed protein product [Meloidogyne enterolobii]|uniref:Uncharacterized protein n=1 Tax=Meloidogyne enterolobii TaxID=390850 RepID=A0ACB0YWB2_MELEN